MLILAYTLGQGFFRIGVCARIAPGMWAGDVTDILFFRQLDVISSKRRGVNVGGGFHPGLRDFGRSGIGDNPSVGNAFD